MRVIVLGGGVIGVEYASMFGVLGTKVTVVDQRERVQRARRVVAVGTTALRLLESAAREGGTIAPFHGLTELFLLPGHRFRSAPVLLTNFHLPKSTLFMLACAYAGTARVRAAYDHAIASGYRFYSYGDASLLRREDSAP